MSKAVASSNPTGMRLRLISPPKYPDPLLSCGLECMPNYPNNSFVILQCAFVHCCRVSFHVLDIESLAKNPILLCMGVDTSLQLCLDVYVCYFSLDL